MVVGTFYIGLAGTAYELNEVFKDHRIAGVDPRIPAYDTCQVPSFTRNPKIDDAMFDIAWKKVEEMCKVKPEECVKGTQWTGVFTVNFLFLCMSGFNFLTMTLGAFWFWPRYFSNICNCCLGCCNLGGWTFAISMRYNPIGEVCAMNIAGNTYKDGRFTNEGGTYA